MDWRELNKTTQEIIIDFTRNQPTRTPLHIDGTAVEIVQGTKFLGVHVTNNQTRSKNVLRFDRERGSTITGGGEHIFSPLVLTTLYCMGDKMDPMREENCNVSDHKNLQKVVGAAKIIALTSTEAIACSCCWAKAQRIHPNYSQFTRHKVLVHKK